MQIRLTYNNAQVENVKNQIAKIRIKQHASPVSVVYTVVHEKGKVLLIQRGKPPYKGRWSLPGGRQEFGERLKDAAIRELKEETSIKAQDAVFERVYEEIAINDTGNAEFHVNITIFNIPNFLGQAKAGDDAVDVMWANKENLRKLDMTPNTADIINGILGDLLT